MPNRICRSSGRALVMVMKLPSERTEPSVLKLRSDALALGLLK